VDALTVLAVLAAIGVLAWAGPRAMGTQRERKRRLTDSVRRMLRGDER
jgi:hypothetical protein